MNNNPHIGSSLDDLLEEEGTLAEINSIALKRVIAWQAGDKDGETPYPSPSPHDGDVDPHDGVTPTHSAGGVQLEGG